MCKDWLRPKVLQRTCSHLTTLFVTQWVLSTRSRPASSLWPLRRDFAALGGSALRDQKEILLPSLNTYLQSFLGPARGWQPLPHFKIVAWRNVGTGWLSGEMGKQAKPLRMGLMTHFPRETYPPSCPNSSSPSFLPNRSQTQASALGPIPTQNG